MTVLTTLLDDVIADSDWVSTFVSTLIVRVHKALSFLLPSPNAQLYIIYSNCRRSVEEQNGPWGSRRILPCWRCSRINLPLDEIEEEEG
jgi:hypothetical protein